MADLSVKGSESSSESQIKRSKNKNQDASAVSPSSSDNQFKKTCVDCGTSKTPLWRGGPGGPKSLCNACGIRNRKRRRALLGLNKTVETKLSSNNNNNSITTDSKLNDSLKGRLFKLGKEFMLQKANAEKLRVKLGEVEQAAVLLMALSYGSVSA